MELNFKLTTLLLCIVCVGAGQYYAHLQNGKKATVQHIRDPHNRSERSVRGRPEAIFTDSMDFDVTLENGQIISLRLKLNKRQIGKVLVKVISESGVEFFDSAKPKDYRFYQVIGEDHSAAVMVRCEKFQKPCYIAGSFYHNMEEYLIDPDTDIAHVTSSIPHTVYIVKPSKNQHSYDHDTVKVIADTPDDTNEGKRNRQLDSLSHLLKLHRNHKTKRQATQKNYKIELEMVVADDVYALFGFKNNLPKDKSVTSWLSRMSNNSEAALEKIEEYFEQVANNMDLRFSTATTSTMTVDIVPLVITVIQDKSNNSWITNNIVNVENDGDEAYNADKALEDLYSWAVENKDQNADALVCFSRRDMWSYGLRSENYTVGIARFLVDNLVDKNPQSSLCTNSAVSLNEVFRNGDTSATATHELAHNMGILHDREYKDTSCPDEKLYIMAGTLGFVSKVEDANNPWYFSNCSVSEKERIMSTIKVTDGKTCLERHSYNVSEYNTIRTSALLGEIYSLDEQCKLLNGNRSRYCNNTRIGEDEICWRGLVCKSIHGDYCDYKTPLPGSSCGGTKKCYRGECVNALPAVVTELPPSPISQSSNSTSLQTSPSSTSTTTTTTSTTPSLSTASTSTTTTSTNAISSTSSSSESQTTSVSSTTSTAATTASSKSATSATTTSSSTTSSIISSTTSSSTASTTSLTTPSTPSTKSSTTSSTAPTTSSTTSSTTSTPSSTTSSTTSSTSSSAADVYTQNEYDWLVYFYYKCGRSCYCWRTVCWTYNKRSLCQRFASVCYA